MVMVPTVSQPFYCNQTLYKTDNGHFEIVNVHLWGAECDRKLRFGEEKFLNYQVRDSF